MACQWELKMYQLFTHQTYLNGETTIGAKAAEESLTCLLYVFNCRKY